ncbi:MAG: hypothetical protein ACKVH0_22185, partial [Alphaproteobacteria bacterium]
ALGVIVALRRVNAADLSRASLLFLCALLTGVVLERFAGLDGPSDVVRAALFPPDIVYAEDIRDRRIHGAVRAKLFTSEPSHVSKAFVLGLLIWSVTARTRWRLPCSILLLAAGAILIRSPGVLVAGPAILVSEVCRLRNQAWMPVFLLLGVLLVPLALLAGEAAFPERLAHAASGRDGSFLIRFTMPMEVMLRVWAEHPLFGLRFGAKESGIPYALSAASDLSLNVEALLTTNAPLGNNGVLIGLIQLGAVGGLAFAGVIAAYWRFTCRRYWIFVTVALVSFMTLIGGVNDPRFWGGFALLTAAGAAAYRRDIAP